MFGTILVEEQSAILGGQSQQVFLGGNQDKTKVAPSEVDAASSCLDVVRGLSMKLQRRI